MVKTFHNMASSNETLKGESEISQEGGTEYASLLETPPNTVALLLCMEKMDGEPLPENLMVPRYLNMLCVQYAGEQPYYLEFLNHYEVCVTFKEGTPISVIAGRLMNVSTWQDYSVVISCTIVPRNRVDAIVQAREGVRGPWNDMGECVTVVEDHTSDNEELREQMNR